VNYFELYAPRLLAHGYLIVPITPGSKRPPLDGWREARLTVQDVPRYASYGVGILHGQGSCPVIGIDIDTAHEEVSASLVRWCHKHIGYTPPRIGRAPKTMLYYRGPRMKKWTGPWFMDRLGGKHRIEILGDGQQSVAYAIHPDTQQPYQWDDITGDGIVDINAFDLPEFTEAHFAEFVEVAKAAMLKYGLEEKGVSVKVAKQPALAEGSETIAPPLNKTVEEIEEHLQYLDRDDYDTWIQVGMALHHQFNGASDGLEMWDRWSAPSSRYVGIEDLETRWHGFKPSASSRTIRWVIKAANEAKSVAGNRERENLRGRFFQAIEDITEVSQLDAIAREAVSVTNADPLMRAEVVAAMHKRHNDLMGEGKKVPIGVIRAMLDTGSATEARRQYTEVGNAHRMIDAHGKSLMYANELGRWYRWAGVRWREATETEVQQLAQRVLDSLFDEGRRLEGAERESFLKFTVRSQTYKMVLAMVGLAKADARVLVGASSLDSNKLLFAVGNGVVDLSTGALVDPNPKQLITIGSDVDYDPDARCPLWEQTILEVFDGDFEVADFFQRLVGYTLLGDPVENLLVIPYGSGANGKSTVFGVLREVFGQHSATAGSSTFTSEREFGSGAGAPREDLLRLRTSRLVLVSEPEEGSHLREALVKQATGGQDRITARGIHAKASVEFTPSWVPFMPTNHMPVVKGEDEGIWRRLLPVPFTVNFEKSGDKDLRRAERLKAELPGILAWCVQGCLSYQANGLKVPPQIQVERAAYREAMDLLGEFIETRCALGEGQRATTSELWMAWEAFARTRGELRLIPSAKSLGRRLRNRFKPAAWRRETGEQVRGWTGIGLSEASE
jgi:putative DNA primase/helicase